MSSLEDVQAKIRVFNRARDWEQYHSPKNLAMAICGEAGELSALLQWVEPDGFGAWAAELSNRQRLGNELADVLIYALQLADAIGADPIEVMEEKLRLNEANYPVETSRGSALKYDQLPMATGFGEPS